MKKEQDNFSLAVELLYKERVPSDVVEAVFIWLNKIDGKVTQKGAEFAAKSLNQYWQKSICEFDTQAIAGLGRFMEKIEAEEDGITTNAFHWCLSYIAVGRVNNPPTIQSVIMHFVKSMGEWESYYDDPLVDFREACLDYEKHEHDFRRFRRKYGGDKFPIKRRKSGAKQGNKWRKN